MEKTFNFIVQAFDENARTLIFIIFTKFLHIFRLSTKGLKGSRAFYEMPKCVEVFSEFV